MKKGQNEFDGLTFMRPYKDVLREIERREQLFQALLVEVKQLRKDLKDAEDVISCALDMTKESGYLDMTSNDEAIAMFKDFLGVEE